MTLLLRVKNCLAGYLRARRLHSILEVAANEKSLLDVGVWTEMPEPHPNDNIIEKSVPSGIALVCVGLASMKGFSDRYPQAICVQADGKALPFKDESFDVVVANAVLEHVGEKSEISVIREMTRVTRKICFISVPDRFCPIEVHSNVPFIHWFPFWRSFFTLSGRGEWADPCQLNLFTKRSLHRKLRDASGATSWKVKRQYLGIIPISLIAVARTPRSQGDH